jgi:ATP-binding cassette subfamily B protein
MTRLVWQAYPAGFVGLLLLTLVQGLVPLGTAWLTKVLFDWLALVVRGDLATPPVEELAFLLLAQAALTILGQLTTPLNNYLNLELSRRVTLNVESTVYTKVNSLLGLAPFEDPRFHNTIDLAAAGAKKGPTQVVTLLTTVLQGGITLVGFLTVLIAVNPLLAAVVALSVLPQVYGRLKMSRQRVSLAIGNNPKERKVWYYRHILIGVQFAKELRLFNLGEHFLSAFRRTYQEIHTSQREQQARELRVQLGFALLSNGLSAGVFVVVVLQAFAGNLSLGDVTLYSNSVSSVQGAMSGLIMVAASLTESVLFYRHYTDLLSLPQPLPVSTSARPVPPLTSSIELRNVSFRYSDKLPWVLRDVNLVVPSGQCVAIVGLNGAGKTTLVKLLTRLYDPTKGEILWDGIDIRDFDPKELRCRIGAIFQDFARYDLTVQENISLGDVSNVENSAAVRRAASAAGIDRAIEALPQGYQTVLSRWLGDDMPGVDLSGGEWQKIALARMFMRKADLLILDEPTSALDAQAEYEIYNHFVELMSDRTSLLITHRFSTARMANAVAVLEDGLITEYGSHDELLAQGATYAKLYNMQAERYQ